MKNFKFIFFGALFGLIITKTEAVSWYRIQEMFHFQIFHMYGIIGSAVVVGMISVFIIKRFQMKSVNGETIDFPDKTFNKGSVIGGTVFGMGWALAGLVPDRCTPLLVQVTPVYGWRLQVRCLAPGCTVTYGPNYPIDAVHPGICFGWTDGFLW